MRELGILCMMLWVSTMVFANELEKNSLEKATFAGGCFWCMEHPFDALDGVLSTTSGYVGGFKENPTYQEVSAGETGHTEAVQLVFNPEKVSYETLLGVYWRNSDPTTANRQFCDVGSQYRPGIFYHSEKQRTLAEDSKATLQKNKPFKQSIMTEISPVGTFWPAESYHQNYYLKNPVRYRFYRYNCGRDQRLQELWGNKGE
ncbi:MAG: peptide-methionine (S)-S-oxide reductase MsrA [Mariprofundaceae bacterium]|nr:peptide-methionine (S)-S-oxide reductase MsrA [Mariprofundaceae bacterium]